MLYVMDKRLGWVATSFDQAIERMKLSDRYRNMVFIDIAKLSGRDNLEEGIKSEIFEKYGIDIKQRHYGWRTYIGDCERFKVILMGNTDERSAIERRLNEECKYKIVRTGRGKNTFIRIDEDSLGYSIIYWGEGKVSRVRADEWCGLFDILIDNEINTKYCRYSRPIAEISKETCLDIVETQGLLLEELGLEAVGVITKEAYRAKEFHSKIFNNKGNTYRKLDDIYKLLYGIVRGSRVGDDIDGVYGMLENMQRYYRKWEKEDEQIAAEGRIDSVLDGWGDQTFR